MELRTVDPQERSTRRSGLEVLKLEFILRLKIKHTDWLLATCVRKQPIIALYFKSKNVLKFYNLEARRSGVRSAKHAASQLSGRGPTDGCSCTCILIINLII